MGLLVGKKALNQQIGHALFTDPSQRWSQIRPIEHQFNSLKPRACYNVTDYNYIQGSPKGPEHWGELNKDWASCSNGTLQSPIAFFDNNVEDGYQLGSLNRTYKALNASLVNRGQTILLKWADLAGEFCVDGTKYNLIQCHWHSPSEHTINGQRYDLELHMVHQSIDGKIAVVGILYHLGNPDPFLSKLLCYIGTIANKPGAERAVGVVDPREIGLDNKEYYRYEGSLTAPPCTEGVLWTIIEEVKTVSWWQMMALRAAVNNDSRLNARPIQPTNQRLVYFYDPPRFKS
ncbi:alpha carbonic anhydrase 7-like [Tasmannia lanceolata]|uniref:alpha carbonic anhydrase 7-like n=1 Tax=Tasmannia lanceolata TaxID=3420 RepID=UPI004063394A